MKNTILQRYIDIQVERRDITERIQKLRALPDAIRDKESIAKLEAEYQQQYMKLCDEQFAIERAITNFEPVEKIIIRLRYFDNLPWEAIFRRIHYSSRQTFRIHEGILKKLNNLTGRHE